MYTFLKRTAQRLLQVKRSLPSHLHGKKALASDPLFNLSAVDRGLQPRDTSPTRAASGNFDAITKRIMGCQAHKMKLEP